VLFRVSELNNVWNIKPMGVLHVGAHRAEESVEYSRFNWGDVVWVEAQPELVIDLRKSLNGAHNTVIEAAVWNESGLKLEFNIASNGESSSLLELGSHATSYPNIRFERSISVLTKRLDEVIPTIKFADFLNIDIQGAELMALQGLGSRIQEFNWIYTEVNKREVYSKCTLIEDLDQFLKLNGFKRVATRWIFGKGWGDALYLRETLSPSHLRKFSILKSRLVWIIKQSAWSVKGISKTYF
jgi:FkbM family methyltransferase